MRGEDHRQPIKGGFIWLLYAFFFKIWGVFSDHRMSLILYEQTDSSLRMVIFQGWNLNTINWSQEHLSDHKLLGYTRCVGLFRLYFSEGMSYAHMQAQGLILQLDAGCHNRLGFLGFFPLNSWMCNIWNDIMCSKSTELFFIPLLMLHWALKNCHHI